MSKSKNRQRQGGGTLPVPVVLAAVSGDPDAINTVLNHYRGYINVLSTKRLYDEYGNAYLAVDEELRHELETRLIAKILTLRPLTAA
jgi:hypothetical protein